MKIIIIGMGTGGLFSAVTIKKIKRDAEIVFFDKKDFDILHPCYLPYAIEGRVNFFDSLKSELPDMGFIKFHKHEVKKIIPNEKKLLVENLNNKEISEHNYDKLIIASGGKQFIPDMPGIKLRGVFSVNGYRESFELSEYIKTCKKAVIAGAGAIGLETAIALKKRGLDVTVVEMMKNTLPNSLDSDIAMILDDYLKKQGIALMFNSKLMEIKGKEKVSSVVLNTKENIKELETDLVVLAMGVRGNHEFVGTDIDMGKYGIITNERMQTNHPDIYAIGDCIQVKSFIDNRNTSMHLAVAAYKQGLVAGKNILGIPAKYKGALGTFASKIGDMQVAATGFHSDTKNIETISGKAKSLTKPSWFSGEDITFKIISDKNGMLIGGQAIGFSGAAARINMLCAAISSRASVYNLTEMEMAYCPEVSETYDVLMQAADNLIRKINRGKK